MIFFFFLMKNDVSSTIAPLRASERKVFDGFLTRAFTSFLGNLCIIHVGVCFLLNFLNDFSILSGVASFFVFFLGGRKGGIIFRANIPV